MSAMEFLDDDIADVIDISAWLDNCAGTALPGVGDGCDVVGIVPMKLNTGIEVAPTIVGRSEPGVGVADGLVQVGIVNVPAPAVPVVAVAFQRPGAGMNGIANGVIGDCAVVGLGCEDG